MNIDIWSVDNFFSKLGIIFMADFNSSDWPSSPIADAESVFSSSLILFFPF